MRVLKIIWFKLFLILPVIAFTQEGAILMPLIQDSTQIELEKQIEYQQLISGQFSNELLLEQIQLPEFDFNSEFSKRYAVNQNIMAMDGLPLTDFTLGLFAPFYSPYPINGIVLSQAAYKVNDRFVVGGFSYGTNSLPTLPPAPGINNFNRYGSTMFMQYKVGKNFKIETRVNVSQGGMHPGY